MNEAALRPTSGWWLLLLALPLAAATPPACEERAWTPSLKEAIRLQGKNEHAKAAAAYKTALKVAERCGANSIPVVLVLNNYGSLEHVQGRLREAERLYQRSRTILIPLVGRQHPLLARVTCNLAHIYLDARRYARAKEVLRDTLDGRDAGSKEPNLALLWMSMAYIHTQEEQYEEAEEIYRRQIPVLLAEGEPFRESAAGAYTELANLLVLSGRPEEALAAAEQALALLDKGPVFYVTGLVRALNLNGAILMRSRHEAEAIPLLERAIQALDGASMPVHPLAHDLLMNYATCLSRVGRKAEAGRVRKEAAARLEQLKEDYPAAETIEYSDLLREAHK